MFKRLKSWWHFNKLQLTSPRKKFSMLAQYQAQRDIIDVLENWAIVRPVVNSLKHLRNNTWDKDRVDNAIAWLEGNYKPEESDNAE